jgi:beta-lactamase class A
VRGRIIFFVILVCAVIFYVIGRENSKPNLHKTVLNALSGAKGNYSVSIENFKTKEKESLFGDKAFKVGSLYKLWIMGETFRQIQAGLLSEDEVLSEDVSVLNKDFNIDPKSAELTDGTIVLTVRSALKQMIDISHNYAALLLTKKIKLSNVAEFLKTNGFNASHVGGTPTSTADDIALFYKKLYKGELANKQYALEMLDLLKAQTLNDKLPKYLPKGTVAAHKTGEIEYLSHDAGIIYTPNGDYIIVVLSESSYPLGAEERIAQISKSVFDYFSSQNK